MWHCWLGMEHTHGTGGQTKSTHGTLLGAQGAHVAQVTDWEHGRGIDGQTENTWHPWTDQKHTCGIDGQSSSTHVAKPSGHE